MTDEITRHHALMELADQWEEEALRFEALDPNDRAAKTMRRNASQLREVVDLHSEPWVTHAQIRLRTGRSDSYLYDRYRDYQRQGRARKRNGLWEVTRSASLEIPIRQDRDPLEDAQTPEEMASVLMDRADRRGVA